MALLLFGNPVRTVIHPPSWNRPARNYDFEVSQWFGCTGFVREPRLGTCAHYHRGLDVFNGRCGDDALAMRAGVVHFAGRLTDGAISVIIDHGNGWFSGIAHLSREVVSKGQHVAKGQKIGSIGTSGNSTGCHGHVFIKSGAVGSRSMFDDNNGRWEDPWAHLEQNATKVLVRPKSLDKINIRTTAASTGIVFATTHLADNTIRRAKDNVNLGAITAWYMWGGTVSGGSWKLPNGATGKTWEKIKLGATYYYIASGLAIKSA